MSNGNQLIDSSDSYDFDGLESFLSKDYYGKQLINCCKENDISGVDSLLNRSDKLSFIQFKDQVINYSHDMIYDI